MSRTTCCRKKKKDPSSYSDLRESNSASVVSVSHGVLLGFIKAAKTLERVQTAALFHCPGSV